MATLDQDLVFRTAVLWIFEASDRLHGVELETIAAKVAAFLIFWTRKAEMTFVWSAACARKRVGGAAKRQSARE